MERKFFTNDFEKLLKDNADQFKMSPSKKVWRGIYNDIHPGRRWPSIAMSLVFVFTLVLVGHLNTQQSQHSFLPNLGKNESANLTDKKFINRNVAHRSENKSSQKNIIIKNTSPNAATVLALNNQVKENSGNTANEIGKNENFITASNDVYTTKENSSLEQTPPVSKMDGKDVFVNNNVPDLQPINNAVREDVKGSATPGELPLNSTKGQPVKSSSSKPVNVDDKFIRTTVAKNTISTASDTKNKTSVTSRIKIHKNLKIDWSYYVSPSISYRTYSKQGNSADQIYLGNNSTSPNTSISAAVTHSPSAGIEAGTSVRYAVAKKFKLTSGVQLNYSEYTIQANNIHPIISTLILHNEKTGTPYPFSTISYFGNGPGNVPVNLHNYNFELSLPVGFEYQFAGNDRIQVSAAGSFQPSLLLADQAYILSTDKRNYLTEASLTRHWNMSTNIGTYVSFNSNKFKWQVGPQVHYQLLSTYKNEYQVREHYIDYGIRLGISKLRK